MRSPSSRRLWLFRAIALTSGLAVSIVVSEITCRYLDRRESARSFYEGSGGLWMPDTRWGWKSTPGWYRSTSPEFVAGGNVNADFMNDVPVDPVGDAGRTRIYAIGDSHTFATGVSQTETWPKQLEARLNHQAPLVRVYNAGTTGYNMHQYVLRVTDQAPGLRPHIVIAAVTFASDFFDLLPPDRGGWIHGGDMERDYFDFDGQGTLVERHWSPGQGTVPGAVQPLVSRRVRSAILGFATFRYFRRSPVALALAARTRLGSTSLWPNMDIAMEREVPPRHEYHHRLFRALLARLKAQTDRLHAQLVIVGIPYLPQVYDGFQRLAFSGERFDRGASSRRLAAYSSEVGAAYVDALEPMRTAVAASGGRWVHFPSDGHPNREGHAIIAAALASASAFRTDGDRR